MLWGEGRFDTVEEQTYIPSPTITIIIIVLLLRIAFCFLSLG